MVTVIYSLGKVNGADIMLLGWGACAIVYVATCLLAKGNRCREGIREIFWYLLACEVVTDIIWAILYYEDGKIENEK